MICKDGKDLTNTRKLFGGASNKYKKCRFWYKHKIRSVGILTLCLAVRSYARLFLIDLGSIFQSKSTRYIYASSKDTSSHQIKTRNTKVACIYVW